MCFSERVSWAAFAVSAVAGGLALARGPGAETRVLAATLLVVGSMQLFEALLWRDPSSKPVARAAAVVNHAQPAVFWALSAAFLAPPQQRGAAAAVAAAAVVAYLAIIVPYTARALRRPGPLVVVGRDGLEWTWNYAGGREVAYGLFVASACATAWAYFADPMPVVAAILLSFGASHLAYRDTAVVGSMWCFFAALFPIALLWRSE